MDTVKTIERGNGEYRSEHITQPIVYVTYKINLLDDEYNISINEFTWS